MLLTVRTVLESANGSVEAALDSLETPQCDKRYPSPGSVTVVTRHANRGSLYSFPTRLGRSLALALLADTGYVSRQRSMHPIQTIRYQIQSELLNACQKCHFSSDTNGKQKNPHSCHSMLC